MTSARLRLAQAMIAALAFVWVVGGLAGCANKPSDKDLVLIAPDEAIKLAQGKRTLVLNKETGVYIDARSESDFHKEHIPGAISLPYERVTEDHKMLDQYPILIVYGADYNDARANGMSKRLMTLGHGDVRTLNGGLRAWKTAGNPVEASEAQPSAPK